MDSARVTSDVATPGRRQVRRVGIDSSMAAALAIGGAHTLVVILLPGLRLAYQNPALHLTLETAEGLIAGLLAYLAAGRFPSTRRLEQLEAPWSGWCERPPPTRCATGRRRAWSSGSKPTTTTSASR